MATFVYAPGIRVRIESKDKGIIDVSGDITQWTLTRRSNTVSSFVFTLQNAQRKYDGVFRPSDRITVELKRITWVRVFTGSLNSSPVFSAWPRALPMSASCTLKKLQFWPWNPTTQAAADMISTWTAQGSGNTNVGDSGLSKLATTALQQVCNWDPTTPPMGNPKNVHFGQVPNAWFEWAKQTENQISAASSMQAILGSHATLAGNSIVGTIPLPPDTYAGATLTSEMCSNISQVYAVILGQSGLSTAAEQDRAALVALMVIGQESTFQVLTSGPDGSQGLYQQIPSWGSAAERTDITHSTLSFLKGTNGHKGLFDISGWQTMDPTIAAQTVQVSKYPTAYAKWQSTAQAVITKLRAGYNSQLSSQTGTDSIGAATGIPSGQGSFKSTGVNVATVAYNLVSSRPAGSITYSQSNVSPPQSSSPTVLDCSSLVEWVYYHATGTLLNHRTSEDQYGIVTKIPVELAAEIQGALVFIVDNGDAHHVGVSMGGNKHVAAHTDGIPVEKQVTAGDAILGQFNQGGLLPGIDYSTAAATETARAQLQTILKTKASLSTDTVGSSGTNPSTTSTANANTPFESIVSVLSSNIQSGGDVFGGSRELINNQPFLPWIKTITNSSMRSFCSAPNGDFIAWFPDYFGIWGTAAVMNIEPIELQDFTVDWSDQQIVTHEFVIGSPKSLFDATSGGIADAGTLDAIHLMLLTSGIATMDFPQIFNAIYGSSTKVSKSFIDDYLLRFGARPNLDQMPNVASGRQEFFMALWNFMYYWSAQFNAQVPMTFMPELYPGMILRIPAFDFQCYVTDVEHSGSYGDNGAFTTTATIIAPARTSKRDDLFGMLPLGGRS